MTPFSKMEPDVAKGVRRWLRGGIIGVAMVGVMLFASAGTLAWPMGWGIVAVYALWQVTMGLILWPTHPELLAERAQRVRDAESWDMALLSIAGIAQLAKYIVAGLDYRYGWSAGISMTAQILALVGCALSYALMNWAVASNAYFTKVVRVQRDRGHTVATGGPYCYVRHPGYVGTILFELLSPIALGSWWTLIAGMLGAAVMVVRTAKEDRLLQEQLDGYAAYARGVRYRLGPGLW